MRGIIFRKHGTITTWASRMPGNSHRQNGQVIERVLTVLPTFAQIVRFLVPPSRMPAHDGQ